MPDTDTAEFEPRVDEPETAKTRLRAFEDEHLGEDVTRISGHVERGHGSLFKRMTEEQHREYAALERLVEAEQKVADASAALAKAEADHKAALVAVEAAEGKPDGDAE